METFMHRQEAVLSEMKQINADNQQSNNEVKSKISDLTKNIEYHNQMYDDLKKEVVDIQQEISNLRKNELTELRKNNSNLNAELQHIKTQVNNLQQEKLRCKAICFGLPFVQKENIKNSIDNLLAKYKITSNGLNNCRHAQAKNTKKKVTLQ